MEKVLSKNSSPTLLVAMERALTKHIDPLVSIFNSRKASIHISVDADDYDCPIEVFLGEMPPELREAFGLYATRLIAQRLQIQATISANNFH